MDGVSGVKPASKLLGRHDMRQVVRSSICASTPQKRKGNGHSKSIRQTTSKVNNVETGDFAAFSQLCVDRGFDFGRIRVVRQIRFKSSQLKLVSNTLYGFT